MPTLYIMCGCSGAGKSTFIKNHIEEDSQAWVSRDAIRFSLVKENEEYFSKETQVFNIYVNTIVEKLKEGFDVFADATQINKASRTKLLRRIPKELYDELSIIVVKPDITVAIAQDEKRKGTRSYTTASVVRRTYYSMEEPMFEEGFDHIYYTTDGEHLKEVIK